MMEVLAYPMAIFINIASEATHAAPVPEDWKGRITCLAVSLHDGKPQVISAALGMPTARGVIQAYVGQSIINTAALPTRPAAGRP